MYIQKHDTQSFLVFVRSHKLSKCYRGTENKYKNNFFRHMHICTVVSFLLRDNAALTFQIAPHTATVLLIVPIAQAMFWKTYFCDRKSGLILASLEISKQKTALVPFYVRLDL